MENLPHLSLSSLELIEHALLSEMSRLEKKSKKIRINPLRLDLGVSKRTIDEYQKAYEEVRSALDYYKSIAALILGILEEIPCGYGCSRRTQK